MLGAPVVPQDDVAFTPGVGVNERGPPDVFGQIGDERPAFRLRHAGDVRHVHSEIERFTAAFGVGADQGGRDRRARLPLGIGMPEDELVVHREDRGNASYAYMLSRMEYPAMPLPFGVLRAIKRPSYTEMLTDQVDAAIAAKGGIGDLNSLFSAGDTWVVD